MKCLHDVYDYIFATADVRVESYIKVIVYCKSNKYRRLGVIFSRRLQRKYGVYLSYHSTFDSSLTLRHPVGIVIGNGVSIGKNVTIFQNVTLGRGDSKIEKYPSIGNGTVIYAGAVIIGDVQIGDNCIIGANSVVTKSMPNNVVIAGVPAKIISKR